MSISVSAKHPRLIAKLSKQNVRNHSEKKNCLFANFEPWRIKKAIVFSNKLKKKSLTIFIIQSKILLTNLNFRKKIRHIMKRGNSKSSKAYYYLTGPDPNNLDILILRYFGDPFF